MIGNVNGIVESMFASDRIRSSQNTANTKTGSAFSDYLEYALLNSRSGALFGNGVDALPGSVWQTFALKALVDGLQKSKQGETASAADKTQENSNAVAREEKKPDWAKIRVIHRYKAPMAQEKLQNRGVLV